MGFSTIAYVNSRFLAKIFKKYMPAEETDEAEDMDGTEGIDELENTDLPGDMNMLESTDRLEDNDETAHTELDS